MWFDEGKNEVDGINIPFHQLGCNIVFPTNTLGKCNIPSLFSNKTRILPLISKLKISAMK
jgi:hypothetical protein